MQRTCETIIQNAKWRDIVMRGLHSADETVFHDAQRAAGVLEIDTWEFHWNRLQNSPLESSRWFHVMTACNSEQIDEVLSLAERTLPLDEVASGPALEHGLGPMWQPHSCLDYILQQLHQFPGHGLRFIEAGIRSPVIRNRNMALAAASAWNWDALPKSLTLLLGQALQEEPDPEVRQRIEKVLAGEPLTSE